MAKIKGHLQKLPRQTTNEATAKTAMTEDSKPALSRPIYQQLRSLITTKSHSPTPRPREANANTSATSPMMQMAKALGLKTLSPKALDSDKMTQYPLRQIRHP